MGHVRKVCDFFLARHLRVYSGISGFLPLLRKRKEIPGTLGKLCSVVFPKHQSWHLLQVSPASQVEKGMAVHNKSLRLHYGCLQKPTVGFVCDGCLGGQSWHHSITQVAIDSKKKSKSCYSFSLRGKKKEIPWNTWEVMQRGTSQMPNLALAAGEPSFSGGKGHGCP